ncbi:hypothetical protein SPRG_18815 [Saprolegnia parasitica CBS 223.65]|uniref:Uncharacterized protein n=1 Tax=Saprolegnia parasitica (strain CBS 223.65) TaxID=695850 RepID=A0A067CYU0_SAPPC|nr:hypothetical protein SPRG_18815 [Saprolegnia parasitica CBS 223.65]KDO35653.1 hypothetical protein SPRG_18815 [Saprolegnia parasitica CBS 223.65]|eukprot:XP_012194032.1 hypothetical protein SPRG_18815 [Saprolegnia parasitica CBS 223.65]
MPPADAAEFEATIESAENNGGTDESVAEDANDRTDENQESSGIKAYKLVVDPAWDGAAFTSMMQTDLLTYSLSLSVAPLAKAIEAMGTSLQKHDDTLLQLLQYCRHLETENQNLAQSAQASKDELLSHVGTATQGVRDELLGLMQPLAAKTETLTDDLAAATATIADLATQMHIKATEVTPSLPPVDPAMPQLERMKMIEDRLRECVTMHGLDQLRDEMSAMLPSTSGLASTNELSALKNEMEASLEKQAKTLQDQLAALQTSIEDVGKAAKAHAPTPHLHELKRAQSYNTALKPSTLGSVTPPALAAPPPPVDLTEVHRRLNQEEELLEALRQQYEALQEALQGHASDVAELKLQVAITPSAELYAPRTNSPGMAGATGTSDNEIPLDRNALDALGRDMTDARTKLEQFALQLRRLDPLEKQVRDLEAAQVMLQSDSDAQKAVSHALQTELRKFANDFRAFQDDQGLMQSFSTVTSSGDGSADFSQVLGRLAEMRAAQDAAMDELRSRMDTMSDDNSVTQQWVHRLQNDAKFLSEASEKHSAHIADWVERDDDDRQMALRHIEMALLKEKEGLQRALQAQERLGIGFVDLHQHALALRKDLERLSAAEVLSVKLPDIQGLHTAFGHLLAQMPPLVAMPALLKDSLARLGNDIEAAHLPSDDSAELQDKLTSLLQMLHTLEQHNTDMTAQNALAKNTYECIASTTTYRRC